MSDVAPYNSLGFLPIAVPTGGCCDNDNDGGGSIWEYYPSGDTTGVTDSPTLKTLMQTNRLYALAPGTYYIRNESDDYFATMTGLKGITDLTGREFVLVGDPTRDLGDGTKNLTYGPWFGVFGCTDFGWVNYDIRHEPDPTSEVIVTAINGNVITCKALPGRGPKFPIAGGIGVVTEPETGSFRGWQHTTTQGTNEPEAVITPRPDLGVDMMTITFPDIQTNIVGARFSYGAGGDLMRMYLDVVSTMGFRAPMTIQVDGVIGLTSGGQSVVNGKKFALKLEGIEDEDFEGEVPPQAGIELNSILGNIDRIFPNDTTAWVSGGTVTSKAPSYISVGDLLSVTMGKKRGGHFVTIGNKGLLKFAGRTRSCTGIGFYGRDNEDVWLEPDGRGNGLIAFNHGTALMSQTFGRFYIPRYYVKGCGDAHLALNATILQGINETTIPLITPRSITVPGWGSTTRMDNRTPRPRAGQRWGYLMANGDLNALVNVVDRVEGTTVFFTQDHPVGYDPTVWKIVPLDANRELVIGDAHCVGAWTVGFTTFFQKTRISNLYISNTGGPAFTLSNPGTRWGSKVVGGGYPFCKTEIVNLVVERCGYRNRTNEQTAILGRRFNGANSISASGNNPEIAIGYCTVDHFGFSAIMAAGVNIRIGVLDIRNRSEYRNNPDFDQGGVLPIPNGPGATKDITKINANVSIGAFLTDNPSGAPTFYFEGGGTYTPPGGSLAPTRSAPGGAVGGETTILSPVPVPAGMEWMVRVFLGDQEVDGGVDFTANGTATLTLANPLPAGMAWRVQRNG